MTWKTKLKYAGASAYEREDERLHYEIYIAITQNEEYKKLALTRWLVEELHDDFAGINQIPEDIKSGLFDIIDTGESDLNTLVDIYVVNWINENEDRLLEIDTISEQDIEEAYSNYDIDREEINQEKPSLQWVKIQPYST